MWATRGITSGSRLVFFPKAATAGTDSDSRAAKLRRHVDFMFILLRGPQSSLTFR